jgi:hypothetical protein
VSDQVHAAAVSWTIRTVYVWFCEQNLLIDTLPSVSHEPDRTDAESSLQRRRADLAATELAWLHRGLDELRRSPLMVRVLELLGGDLVEPSESAASALIGFWRETAAGMGSVIDDLDTGFLGDVYQDLSASDRKAHALLQTPQHVVNLILDRTLTPAIQEFGLSGLRLIDPACGSGTFALAAFDRLVEAWQAEVLDAPPWSLAQTALESVHAADIHPAAASITAFRLVIAAMRAAGVQRLADVSMTDLQVRVCDSLLDTSRARFDVALEPDSYDVVVGNPPYTTVKDLIARDAYRAKYPYCRGAFALTVPFTVRFFELARRGHQQSGGYVGFLTANSFMKREFGRGLVEEFFPTVELTCVIDTSGAYIPGHGTPTAILIGRNQRPADMPVQVIAGVRGEPRIPEDPARGEVWQSILTALNGEPTFENRWVQRADLDTDMLSIFPWNLADSSSREVLRAMNRFGAKLQDFIARIGFHANTGADDLFVASEDSVIRQQIEPTTLAPVLHGSDVRDWCATWTHFGMRVGDDMDIDAFPHLKRRLWPYQTVLKQRANAWRRAAGELQRWFAWHHVTETAAAHPWQIVFSWVSTHNHFALIRDNVAPLTSAPVIRLPASASDGDVMQLLCLLNSSIACFWLKNNSNNKGQPGVGQTGTGEPWSVFYEFAGTRVGELPLPPARWSGDRWTIRADRIDHIVTRMSELRPRELLNGRRLPTDEELRQALIESNHLRGELVALQEELDWELYRRYELIDDDVLLCTTDLPEIHPGERAFEIYLARMVEDGAETTGWFERHGISPVTELPPDWPVGYRQTVERRLAVIGRGEDISRVETPEFKRRWSSADWEAELPDALRVWLHHRINDRAHWFDEELGDSRKPALYTFDEIVERFLGDEEFRHAAKMYSPRKYSKSVIRELIEDQHVPYLDAYRLKPSGLTKNSEWRLAWREQRADERLSTPSRQDAAVAATPPKYSPSDFIKHSYWSCRGKYDIPSEMLISYPESNAFPDLFGWAGWDYNERAAALASRIEYSMKSAAGNDQITPLLAGMMELQPWLELWFPGVADGYLDFRKGVQAERGLSDDDLVAWRPPSPRRGRPPKSGNR